MKTFITVCAVVGLLVAGTAFGAKYIAPMQVYEIFAEIPQEKAIIYKVVDEDVTCYVMSAKVAINSVGKNHTMDCIIK